MDGEWITLPDIARELGIAESTARRWAAKWPDLLTSRGIRAARRFHVNTRHIFRRMQQLFEMGYTTEQVDEVLHREFTATVDAVTVPERIEPQLDIVQRLIDGIPMQLKDMEELLLDKLTASQTEVEALRDQVAQLTRRLAEQEQPFLESRGVPYIRPRQRTDADLMSEIRAAVQSAVAESIEASPRRSWWPWKRYPS